MLTLPTTWGEAARHADDLLAGAFAIDVAKALDPTKPREYLVMVNRLSSALRGAAAGTEGRVLRETLRSLKADWHHMNPRQIDQAIRAARQAAKDVLGKTRPEERIGGVLEGHLTRVANATKTSLVATHGFAVQESLNRLDQEVLRQVTANASNFVRDNMGNRVDAMSDRARRVVSEGLEAGLGRTALASKLAQELSDFSAHAASNYWSVVASQYANTARTWASLSVYQDAGYTIFRVVAIIDTRTTPWCAFIDGRTFRVDAAMNNMRQAAVSGTPRPWVYDGRNPATDKQGFYYKDGGEKQWIGQIDEAPKAGVGGSFSNTATTAELTAAGIDAPPYHAHCRTTIIADTTAGPTTTAEPSGGRTRAPREQPAPRPAPTMALPPIPSGVSPNARRALDDLHTNGQAAVYQNARALKPVMDADKTVAEFGTNLDGLPWDQKQVKLSQVRLHSKEHSLKEVQDEIVRLDKASREGVRSEIRLLHDSKVAKASYQSASHADDLKVLAHQMLGTEGLPPKMLVADLRALEFYGSRGLPKNFWDLGKPALRSMAGAPAAKAREAVGRVFLDAIKTDPTLKKPETQRALRRATRKYLEDHYGASSRAALRGQQDVLEYVKDGALGVNTGGMYSPSSGSFAVTESGFARTVAQAQELAATGRWGTAGRPNVGGFRTILHEELHGASPMGRTTYKGLGIGIEEMTTEVLARRATRELAGFVENVGGNTMAPLPLVNPVALQQSRGLLAAPGQGAYRDFLDETARIMSRHMKAAEVADNMERGAIWVKSAAAKMAPREAWGTDRTVGEFVRAMGLPKEKAAALYEDLMQSTALVKSAMTQLWRELAELEYGDARGAFALYKKARVELASAFDEGFGESLGMVSGDALNEYLELVRAYESRR